MIVQDIKRAIDTLANPGKSSAIKGPDVSVDRFTRDIDSKFYKTNRQNWYKALPYGFKFRNRQGKEHVMFLPISPENLTITTHYATNVITTLYGTVEEHSEQRYFDILIEGTTGIMPKYPAAIPKESLSNLKSFSSSGRGMYGDATGFRLSIGSQIAGGFFSQTIGVANQILGKAQDMLNGKESMDVSGIDDQSATGYQAFHRLYKFFLEYKADASGIREGSKPAMDRRKRSGDDDSSHPLSFLNYKDNQQYDVSIQRFTLKRDTSNPMLYKYSITLRAYNLRGIGESMGLGGLPDRLSALGLDGVESSTLLSQVSSTTRNVKQIAAAALGGLDILGR
jgi:hypothetical protein